MAIQPCDEQHLQGKLLRLAGHQGNSRITVDRLTAHETEVVRPIVGLVNEETKIMHDQLKIFCISLDYARDSIS